MREEELLNPLDFGLGEIQLGDLLETQRYFIFAHKRRLVAAALGRLSPCVAADANTLLGHLRDNLTYLTHIVNKQSIITLTMLLCTSVRLLFLNY